MLTTVIGAYPKPSFLQLPDWFNAEGGTDTLKPTVDYDDAIKKMGKETESIFLKAAKEVIDDQIECGIDIITDGEVRRENYIHYHCRHLKGIDFNQLTKKVARTGNYECLLPTIVNTIEAQDSFLVHDWSLAQNISSQPVKITIPGPMTITDTVANEYYTSNNQLGKDLAKAINVEIKRLAAAGCKYIQVDEPLFARKSQEAIDLKRFDSTSGLIKSIFNEILNRDPTVSESSHYKYLVDIEEITEEQIRLELEELKNFDS